MNTHVLNINYIFSFGKYRGIKLVHIWRIDPYYVHWLIKSTPNFVINAESMGQLSKNWVLLDDSPDSFIADFPVSSMSEGNLLYFKYLEDESGEFGSMTRSRGRSLKSIGWSNEQLEALCEVIDCFPYDNIIELIELNNFKLRNKFFMITSGDYSYNFCLSSSSCVEIRESILKSPYSYINDLESALDNIWLLYRCLLKANSYHENAVTGTARFDGDIRSLQIAFDKIHAKLIAEFSSIRHMSSDMLSYLSSIGIHKEYSSKYGIDGYVFINPNNIKNYEFIEIIYNKYSVKISNTCVDELILDLKSEGNLRIARSGNLYLSHQHDFSQTGGYWIPFDEEDETEEEENFCLYTLQNGSGNFSNYSEWYSENRNKYVNYWQEQIRRSQLERAETRER